MGRFRVRDKRYSRLWGKKKRFTKKLFFDFRPLGHSNEPEDVEVGRELNGGRQFTHDLCAPWRVPRGTYPRVMSGTEPLHTRVSSATPLFKWSLGVLTERPSCTKAE